MMIGPHSAAPDREAERQRVLAIVCPDWSQPASVGITNTLVSNFGCATAITTEAPGGAGGGAGGSQP